MVSNDKGLPEIDRIGVLLDPFGEHFAWFIAIIRQLLRYTSDRVGFGSRRYFPDIQQVAKLFMTRLVLHESLVGVGGGMKDGEFGFPTQNVRVSASEESKKFVRTITDIGKSPGLQFLQEDAKVDGDSVLGPIKIIIQIEPASDAKLGIGLVVVESKFTEHGTA